MNNDIHRRKAKIIATVGPSCNDEKALKEMIQAGVNIFRINLSHGDNKIDKKIINNIKKLRKKLKAPIAIMLDTKGPEFRLGDVRAETELKSGNQFILTPNKFLGDEDKAQIKYNNLAKDLDVGDKILINDGLIELKVTSFKNKDVITKVITGGKLSSKKALNFPNKIMSIPYISDDDKKDLKFAAEMNVDFIACSFVSNKDNLLQIRNELKKNKNNNISLLAKIENQEGIDNIEEICEEADGLLCARGDLGVEINFTSLPSIQKYVIKKGREAGIPVVVCTEMLESMIYSIRPTRAETSDVAMAIFDGASALMLSSETSIGVHPVKVVEAMHNIIMTSENSSTYYENKINIPPKQKNKNIDALSHSACILSHDIKASALMCFTEAGYTANALSNYRPDLDIVAITNNKKVYYKLALLWGVHPFYQSFENDIYEVMHESKKFCKQWLHLKKNSEVVQIIGWAKIGVGSNSLIQIVKLQ